MLLEAEGARCRPVLPPQRPASVSSALCGLLLLSQADGAEAKLLAKSMCMPFEKVKARIENLTEVNPMLGHRGCRLGISYPEIYDVQVQAVFEAACETKNAGAVLDTFGELQRAQRMAMCRAQQNCNHTGYSQPSVPFSCILIAGQAYAHTAGGGWPKQFGEQRTLVH